MLNFSRALLFLGCVSLVPVAHSAQAAPKIGVLNLVEIMQTSPESKTLRDKIEKEFAVRQQEIIAKQTAMQTDYETYQRDEAVMSDVDKKALAEKLTVAQKELQKMQFEFQQSFSQREQEETQLFLMDMKKAVEVLAKKGNYDLIVRSDFVAYQKDSYDITEQALAIFRDAQGAATK